MCPLTHEFYLRILAKERLEIIAEAGGPAIDILMHRKATNGFDSLIDLYYVSSSSIHSVPLCVHVSRTTRTNGEELGYVEANNPAALAIHYFTCLTTTAWGTTHPSPPHRIMNRQCRAFYRNCTWHHHPTL